LAGFTTGYGGKEVPPYSRFYLGGENDLRGFDIRAVSPVTYIPNVVNQSISVSGVSLSVPVLVKTITFPGGDMQGVINTEYRIPIAGPVAMSLFNDVGTVGVVRRDALQLASSGVQNINANFPLVNQQAQLQLAPGTNFKLRDSAGIEFIVNLPIVQAPFRIYYAYNPLRLHRTLYAPNSIINGRNLAYQCLASGQTNPLHPFNPDSWQTSCSNAVVTAIAPIFAPSGLNYFEPQTTFRFTVSRTF
jgi:outer membrane protein insertion porin family